MRAFRLFGVTFILLALCFGCEKKEPARPYPLHWAVAKADRAKVLSLLAGGADVNSRDWGGLTPLHYAANVGRVRMIELLIAHGAAVDAKDRPYDATPLHYAVMQGHASAVRALIAAGAKMEMRGSPCRATPLWVAFVRQRMKIAGLLLAAGADPNARDEWGRTALHDAALNKQLDVAEFSLAHGVPVNAKDKGGLTPLHEAAWENHLEMVRLLLAHGAEVNARDLDGQTPLHVAAITNSRELSDLLIAQGADPNMKDIRGLTPLDYERSPVASLTVVASGDGKGPYAVIIAKPNVVRHFLRDRQIAFDRVWIPQKQDIESLDLKVAVEANAEADPQATRRRKAMLNRLAGYNREYAGFVEEGRRYIFCNLEHWSESEAQPVDAEFTWISQAQLVIDAAEGKAIRIYGTDY